MEMQTSSVQSMSSAGQLVPSLFCLSGQVFVSPSQTDPSLHS